MSDQKTKASEANAARPEELEDKDLDQASGGYIKYELKNLKSDGNRQAGPGTKVGTPTSGQRK